MVCSPVLSGNKTAVSVTTLSIFDAAKGFEECDKEILVVTTPESKTMCYHSKTAWEKTSVLTCYVEDKRLM